MYCTEGGGACLHRAGGWCLHLGQAIGRSVGGRRSGMSVYCRRRNSPGNWRPCESGHATARAGMQLALIVTRRPMECASPQSASGVRLDQRVSSTKASLAFRNRYLESAMELYCDSSDLGTGLIVMTLLGTTLVLTSLASLASSSLIAHSMKQTQWQPAVVRHYRFACLRLRRAPRTANTAMQ